MYQNRALCRCYYARQPTCSQYYLIPGFQPEERDHRINDYRTSQLMGSTILQPSQPLHHHPSLVNDDTTCISPKNIREISTHTSGRPRCQKMTATGNAVANRRANHHPLTDPHQRGHLEQNHPLAYCSSWCSPCPDRFHRKYVSLQRSQSAPCHHYDRIKILLRLPLPLPV